MDRIPKLLFDLTNFEFNKKKAFVNVSKESKNL